MFPKLTKWCGQWRRRRTQFGKEYRQCGSFFISTTVILVSLTSAQIHGSGNKTVNREYRYDYDDGNGASNVYHYYADEVIIQSQDVDEKQVGLNVLLRNLTEGDSQQEINELKENTMFKPSSSHLSGNQNFYDVSGVHGFSPVQQLKNVDWNHRNKIATSNAAVDNIVTQITTPAKVQPVIENEFEHHFIPEQVGDKELQNPLPLPITNILDHTGPDEFEVVKRKEYRGQYSIISIIVIYLFVSVLAYGALILSENQCATPGMDVHLTNWKFHARRRFLPAQTIEPHLQQGFLELFRGIDEDDDDSDELFSSGEKYLDGELDYINTLCPKNAFFFSLSPRHIEAYSALKLLFLQQDSPEAVISLAKYLLMNEKVHPKVWYIAIIGAKLDRQDMAGFSVAHPLDAIPDWYIPADLIVGGSGKYWRSGNESIVSHSRSKNATTKRKGDDGALSSYVIQKKGKWKWEKRQGPHRYFELDHKHGHTDKHKKKGEKGKQKKKKCITVDWRVGVDNGKENELWYWREDMMLNQHHWYWHQTHPPNSTQHGDRRAELFFYMHRAFIARYNAERLSIGMTRVAPLQMRPGGIIPDGYNSHLADINSGLYWTPRGPRTPLQDVYHEDDPDLGRNITFIDYSRNYRRLIKATKSGKLISEMGHPISINHPRGIEPLVNTVDASDLSVNPMFYDPAGIHTLGHLLVGMAADPDFQFRRVTGIMSDGALSMRDPSFYGYHLFLDNLFELHKQQLPPYRTIGGEFPLLWNGVEVVNIELHSQGGGQPNELRTFWTHRKFELSPGIDGSIETEDEHPKVCAQHLDHEPFSFQIVIDRKPCVNSMSGKANVRIFMAPRYDEKGRRIPVEIQRRLMFPLDAFPVKLKVGRNRITRNAEDSLLTQPWTKSLRELERGPSISAEYCGCGWPQHLYIPKGHAKKGGMAFDLFVMVTNYDEDYVPNDPKLLKIPETCNSPYIFCGLPRRRYPDKRPMGFPFDRPVFKSLKCPSGGTFFSLFCKTISATLFKPIDTLEQFVSRVPNMAMLKFHIKHLEVFRPEPAGHY